MTENLVLEHLRYIRAKIDAVDIRLDDLTARVSRMQESMGVTVTALADLNRRLDRHDERLARIERRLHLVTST
jgi:DNA repair ATPase RecN